MLSYVESPNIFDCLQEVYIGQDNLNVTPFSVKNVIFKGKVFFLELEGIENADEAGAFVGRFVFVPPESLEPLTEGEYYWKDIIGLEVITDDGLRIGKITEIVPTGANDVYVCTGEERELLLPAIPEVIKDIDLNKRVMLINLLEGL